MSATLAAEGMTKRFAGRGDGGLAGVDLRVGPGELIALTGPSGSGKTSLLRCLAGTYRPDSGQVVLRCGGDSLELSSAPPRTVDWVRRHHLAVLDGPLVAPPRVAALTAVARLGRRGRAAAAAGLDRLGADALGHLPVGRLRPDEARRVALVAALLAPAPVLLLDEPAAGDDQALAAWLEERRAAGAAIVVAAAPGAAVPAAATARATMDKGELRWHAR